MGDRRCCGECEIAKDSLAGDPLSDTWTLKAGSWNDTAVVDGYTETTGIVELWHVTPHPDDTNGYPSDVRLRIRGAADSKVRLILSASGTVAGGDALIVELEPGTDCGTLRLYQRTDGVEDLLGTLSVYGAVVDEWHDMRCCYDPETEVFTGSILPHDQTSWRQVSADVEAHTDGAYAGFASGTADQSDFDSFAYRKLWYDRIITPLCPEMTVATTQEPHDGLSGDYWWLWDFSDATITGYTFSGTFGGYTLGAALQWDPPDQPSSSNLSQFLNNLNTAAAGYGLDVVFDIAIQGTNIVITATGADYAGIGLQFEQLTETRLPDAQGDGSYAATNEQQTITLTQDGDEGCKTFAVTYNGQTTDPISTAADTATVQTALEVLFGAGNVSVSGSAGAWVVEFTGTLAETDIDLMGVDTTVCGACLDYSYYYEPETERVTCSTCEIGCVLAESHFSNSDSACEWDKVSGDWPAFGGGWLTISQPVVMLHTYNVRAEYKDAISLDFPFVAPTGLSAAKFGILFGCDDTAANGWMARITGSIGSNPSLLELVKITAGVQSVIDSQVMPLTSGLQSFTACIMDGWVRTSFSYNVAVDTPGVAAGIRWGLFAETVSAATGDILVARERLSRIAYGTGTLCPGCFADCDLCVNNFPGEFAITLDGFSGLRWILALDSYSPSCHILFLVETNPYDFDGTYYASTITECLAEDTYEETGSTLGPYVLPDPWGSSTPFAPTCQTAVSVQLTAGPDDTLIVTITVTLYVYADLTPSVPGSLFGAQVTGAYTITISNTSPCTWANSKATYTEGSVSGAAIFGLSALLFWGMYPEPSAGYYSPLDESTVQAAWSGACGDAGTMSAALKAAFETIFRNATVRLTSL
jgi:hypothetical protein